jgi:hypothetical protein
LPRASTSQAKTRTITNHEDSCEETKEKDSGGKDRAGRELPDERGTEEGIRSAFNQLEKKILHEDRTDTLHGLVETGEDTDLAKGVGSLEAVGSKCRDGTIELEDRQRLLIIILFLFTLTDSKPNL